MFIGIDASLTSTGICYLSETGFKLECLKSKHMGVERLEDLTDQLISVIGKARAVEPIQGVAVEGYSMGARQGQLASIGEWGGLVRLTLFRNDIPTIIVPPSNLKKYISGNGQTKKNMMIMHVYKKYGVEVDNDDEADALGLSCMASDYFGDGAELKYEREALEKVTLLFERKKVVRKRARKR